MDVLSPFISIDGARGSAYDQSMSVQELTYWFHAGLAAEELSW